MKNEAVYRKYAELQEYVGWSDADVVRITNAGKYVGAYFRDLVEDFYAEIDRHPEVSRVITEGGFDVGRLKQLLRDWLRQLFEGRYDESYVAHRMRVGQRHVEIGLDQVHVSAALARLQDGMIRILGDAWQGNRRELLLTIQSLCKLISLDQAIIEDAYGAAFVSREKRAERARSEDTFRNLVEAAGCIIMIVRSDRSIAYFSPFAEQVTGYGEADILDRDCLERLVPEDEHDLAASALDRVLELGAVSHFQSRIMCSGGSCRSVIWNARRLDHYEQSPVVLAVGHDITPLKQAQSKALESERLAIIGRMSTGLAHESRNALQRIQAYAEMLELEVDDNAEAAHLVHGILNAQEHVNQLLEEVRGYAAPIRLDRVPVRISSVWREAWSSLDTERKDRQAVLCEDARLEETRCQIDPFRMRQVFRNLLQNALDACEDPVRIVVTCRKIRRANRDLLRVSVRDNGPGLNSEQRQRIFEPFYTTKSKGTGLGMAIAQRAAEAHGGTLEVGDWDHGGEIVLTLPVSE